MQNVLLNRAVGAVPIDKLSEKKHVLLWINSKHFFYCNNFFCWLLDFLSERVQLIPVFC